MAALSRENNVSPRELETYLHQHIPLSAAMQVSVVDISLEQVVLSAPLTPNINHRATAFGGSVSALATLSAWALLHTRLAALGFECTLVIQSNTMQYEKAIVGDFTATASVPDFEEWQAFMRILQRKGRGRITVASVLACDRQVTGQFTGEFVALVG
jgi:thioesterase domain-containing protein